MTTILEILTDKNDPSASAEIAQAIREMGIEIREQKPRVLHVYRVTVDAGRTVRVYVNGVQRLVAQAGSRSTPLAEYSMSFFYTYEGLFDYVAFRGGTASDPFTLPSPPTAP